MLPLELAIQDVQGWNNSGSFLHLALGGPQLVCMVGMVPLWSNLLNFAIRRWPTKPKGVYGWNSSFLLTLRILTLGGPQKVCKVGMVPTLYIEWK